MATTAVAVTYPSDRSCRASRREKRRRTASFSSAMAASSGTGVGLLLALRGMPEQQLLAPLVEDGLGVLVPAVRGGVADAHLHVRDDGLHPLDHEVPHGFG